jgi:AraC family transcriptional regulator
LNEAAVLKAGGKPSSPTRPRPVVGIGRVLLWSGGSLWIGRSAGRASPHAHHAIQISVALSGSVLFRSDPDGGWTPYVGLLIRPHHRHQFDGCGETVAQIFVEPETIVGRALLERQGAEAMNVFPADVTEAMAAPLRSGFAANASSDELIAASKRALALVTGDLPGSSPVDPRIVRAIAHVRARMAGPVTLAEAAAVAHLSPSRFRHLFAEQTGMAFRPYLLWARVEAAVGAAMSGRSWTAAAQDWGFADSAHLSRTCRRMFGVAPTTLVRE